ncbi:hypothetical protein NL676_034065 [Syzygium grande]|nr:hypothetical protein NL676_034065 [Syzygium grande]
MEGDPDSGMEYEIVEDEEEHEELGGLAFEPEIVDPPRAKGEVDYEGGPEARHDRVESVDSTTGIRAQEPGTVKSKAVEDREPSDSEREEKSWRLAEATRREELLARGARRDCDEDDDEDESNKGYSKRCYVCCKVRHIARVCWFKREEGNVETSFKKEIESEEEWDFKAPVAAKE